MLMVIVDKDIDVGQLGIFLTFSCGGFRVGKEEEFREKLGLFGG